jgi:hypothetical protein
MSTGGSIIVLVHSDAGAAHEQLRSDAYVVKGSR